MAQLASALAWGASGWQFKSAHPDMSSGKESLAGKNEELVSPRLLFEHLFPGNSYDELPKSSLGSSVLLLKITTVSNLIRSVYIPKALADESHFAQRVDFDKLSKQLVDKTLNGMDFFGHAHHPVMFKCHHFEDLVDRQKGEKLAGAAVREISHLYRQEIILGVVDKLGKPAALIYFLEGKSPRRPKTVEMTPWQFGLDRQSLA